MGNTKQYENDEHDYSSHSNTSELSDEDLVQGKIIFKHKREKTKSSKNIDDDEQSSSESDNSSCCDESSNAGFDGIDLLNRNLKKLQMFRKANKTKRKAILSRADKDMVQCFCECAYNLLVGNIKLSDAQYNRLKKHNHVLRKLIKPSDHWLKKKEIILRCDEFLLPLLTAVFSNLKCQVL
jgi:hypothetical protein